MQVQIEVDGGLARAQGRIDRLAKRAGNPRPALEDVADEIFKANARLWSSGGYGAWQPQALTTAGNPRVMFESGRLERGLTRRGAEASAMDIDEAAGEVFVGIPAGATPLFYGRFHHRGEGVPQRPVVATAQTVRDECIARIREWLVDD